MFPKVQVNALNLLSGPTKEIERTALFVGVGTVNLNQLTTITADSDFDQIFGKADSELKRQVKAASLNAGQNWFAYVYQLPLDGYDFAAAVRAANLIGSFEYCVNTHVVGVDKAKINALQSLYAELVAKYGRRTFFVQAIEGINSEPNGETWAAYLAKLDNLQKTVVADHVMLVPNLFGNDVGVLAGRLANRAVTIADSPARVRTGAVVELGNAEKPKDKDGVQLDLSHLIALERSRYSTTMWYPDYDGYYWSDGRTLDVEGGDYQAIENVRVVDKVARRVRLQAIGKIADRSFNSTLSSIENHQTFFARTIREMSKSVQIGTEFFPGECMPPSEDAITIVWKTKNQVEIYIKVRPMDCPKEITANIFLDLTTLGGE